MTPEEVAETVANGCYALLFPGAGAQLPGMAHRLCLDHAAAREMLERAEQVTGLPLSRLCRDGTAAELTAPEVSHPAVVATSLAAAAALRRHLGDRWAPPRFVGGHSLGHFGALVAAGSLDSDDALTVVAERARLMGEQARLRPAAMVSVAEADPDVIRDWCAVAPAELGEAVVACVNGPRQTVVSGDERAVGHVAATAEEHGARVRQVATGVASHSPLMRPVQERLASVLASVPLRRPTVPVLVNSTGAAVVDPDALRADLLGQLEAPVLWYDALRTVVATGVSLVLDTGPGQTVARTAQWHPGLAAVALNALQPLAGVVRGG